VNDPALILADEPTGALDSRTSDEILSLFEDLHRDGRSRASNQPENDNLRASRRASR
jgi:ABC-type ATPase involved in cell division